MSDLIDTSGFYFNDGTPELLRAVDWVAGPGFALDRDIPADLTRTVNGWSWFDTVEGAYAAHSLTWPVPLPEPEPDLPA